VSRLVWKREMAHSSGGAGQPPPTGRPAGRPAEECAIAKGIKKSERVPEIAPVSLGELIHAQVRGAIEAAVHEELAAALEAAPYCLIPIDRPRRLPPGTCCPCGVW
jgi:hypothetical protein